MSGLEEHGLNPQQADAVRATEGPLLILAGAGSGKTRVITYRIAHLIQDVGIDPWAIYAVTFTNKAAEQMRARLDQLLGGLGYGGLWISTFHSSCVRILRSEIHHLGYEPHFVIYDDKEQKQLIKEVLKELDLSEKVVDPRMVAGKFDQLKNQGYLPDDDWDLDFGFGSERLRQIYKRYQERLKSMNALDFGDLLVQTTKLFETNDEVRERYARQFEYVLVDEYQDTNKVQYKLIRQLTGEHKNVCVVGDDDQSIYKWRGADITNIFNFERDYPGTRVIKLEQNYRSTQNILKVANAVISHNVGRKGKQLWSAIEGGALVTYHQSEDEHDEARYIVKQARDRDGKWRDIAIFYRTNAQSRVLEEELLKHRIPYNILGGQKFYDRKEVKDALCYLRLLINPVDDVALLRIINTPARGIGPGTVEKLQDSAAQQRVCLLEATRRACTDGTLGTGPTKKVRDFVDMYEKLRKEVTNVGPTELMRSILVESGYIRALEDDGSIEAQSRLENLEELVNALSDYEDMNENPNPAEFLERVALVADADSYQEDWDRVTLMTLHTAKGLEFPVVFMTGMEEGLFPHERSVLSDEDLEEERRLCYVGITRAMRKLFITGAERRRVFGQTFVNDPSRFLEEIPPQLLELSGLAEPGARRRRSMFEGRPSWLDARGEESQEYRAPDAPQPQKRIAAAPSGGGMLTFPVGCKVEHPSFGQGVVKESSLVGGNEKVTVSFARAGVKKLMVKIAPLRRI